MIKDTTFYNKESDQYSEKRYPKTPTNYNQFFFTDRLRHTLSALKKYVGNNDNLSLLETGCADGIVLKEIQTSLPNTFSQLVGTDISPGMIEAAQRKFGNNQLIFKVRNQYTDSMLHDVIVEIGVINYASLQEELDDIAKRLKHDGFAIISLAGTGSLWDRRRKGETGFNTFFSYKAYEQAILKQFKIVEAIPVGLPIPVIWKVPVLARVISKGVEIALRFIAPNLFHEKVYVLKLNPSTRQ
jgi:SAM-dependent methyltransferase